MIKNAGEKKMQYVIGVDGGGTKTRGIIADEKGQEIAEYIVGATNQHSVGFDKAKENLFTLFDYLMSQASTSEKDIAGVCIGLAGIDRKEDEKLFESHLVKKFPSATIRVYNDSFIGLYGGCHQAYGIMVNSGTGTIVFGRNMQGLEARASGWGHILGDEGSGYDIGRRALMSICNAYDGRGESTLLTEIILGKLQLRNAEDLLGWILKNNADKSEIADLSRYVHDAYLKGDKKAMEILNYAADELAKGVKAVANRINIINEEYNLVTTGGNLKYHKEFVDLLKECVMEFSPKCIIIYPKDTPVKGSIMWILKECGFK